MAGSRLEKFGSIFTRVQGLLRSGALKYDDKPLWLELYKRFPPKTNPIYNREVPQGEVKALLYSEDLVRARFFRDFSHNPDLVDFSDDNKKLLISQRFIQKYNSFKADKRSDDVAFDMAKNALKAEGVILRTMEEMRKDEVEKLKGAARERMDKAGRIGGGGIPEATKPKFSAADIFGAATVKRDEADVDQDYFVDEEFDSEDVEEMLKAPGKQDANPSNKHTKTKPNIKY